MSTLQNNCWLQLGFQKVSQLAIMAFGDRWWITKMVDRLFSIIEHADIWPSEVINIYMFYW